MPKFRITSPDGQTYEITAPEGATQEQVLAYAQQHHASAAPKQSPADHYAHYALGRALEKQGKQSEANGHYKLASSLRPQNEHYASRILDLDQDEDGPDTSE